MKLTVIERSLIDTFQASKRIELQFTKQSNILQMYLWRYLQSDIILLHENFLQFDWLREVVFQPNLKYLHVKITSLLWLVV